MKLEIKQRVAALRKFMQGNGIQAFILPTTDPHNSEYVASHWEARKWLTGFNRIGRYSGHHYEKGRIMDGFPLFSASCRATGGYRHNFI